MSYLAGDFLDDARETFENNVWIESRAICPEDQKIKLKDKMLF